MDDDILYYRQLQQDLDRMPVGFPATESGVEIRILRQLFTPVEARIALAVNMLPEPVAAIHKRVDFDISLETLGRILADLAHRGLIYGNNRHVEPRFGKLPFVVGIYEGQVDRMTERLARDFIQYFEEGVGKAIRPGRTPQLRSVPINQPIAVERGVGRYDDIRASVRKSPGPFGVMNCICRQAKDLAGEPCRQTRVRENCLTMGSAATIMVAHGQARFISRERMFELLDEADREGLVLEPQNTRDPKFICLCCGCCCVSLGAAKKLPRPAEFFSPNYFAQVQAAECQVCGECVDRCQMGAVSLDDDAAAVDLGRCIGCGLCVTTCPSGAMTLDRTPEETTPPRGTDALYAQIYRERYGTAGFAKAALRLLTGRKA